MDGQRTPFRTAARRLSIRQTLSAAWERMLWRRRTQRWEKQSSGGLTRVVEAVLDAAAPTAETVAIDLGCGSGQVTLPLAARCARVLAVDVNAAALELLQAKAREAGRDNIQTLSAPIQALELEPSSVDLVVTNYAMHHLADSDKRAALTAAHGWLRPGGRLIVGDMMFGRGSQPGDRAIITAKLRALAARGPAGWWRIAKNVWRFALRVQEMPLPSAAWERLAAETGFAEIRVQRIVQEACVLSARRPQETRRGTPVPAASSRSRSTVGINGATTA